MSPETILITLYFLLPGLVTLAVFEWIFVGRDRKGVELVSWAVGVSVVAAVPLILIPRTRPLVSYLWEPSELSPEALVGVVLHVGVGVLLATVAGWVVLKVMDGRLGPKSFYQRAWDWLWGQHGNDKRYVLVKTRHELLYGTLAFAEDPSKGCALVLADPGVWDEEADDFHRSGMKYAFIPGDQIERIELSVGNPPSRSDYPFYRAGYVDDQEPITEESTDVGQERDAASPAEENH